MKTNKIFSVLLSLTLSVAPFSSTVVYAVDEDLGFGEEVYFNGHKYQLFDVGFDWDEAQDICEVLGGHLAVITSEEEQEFIANLLDTGEMNSYWLGGTLDENNNLSWITGEEVTYTNWANNQPDRTYENCLMIYNFNNPNSSGDTTKKWNDLISDGTFGSESFFGLENFGFICEWEDGDSETGNNEQETNESEKYTWNGHTYQYFDIGMTWDEAKLYCETLGGHLATITSAEEQEQIANLIANGTKNNYWLGGYKADDGNYVWITGESLSYTYWTEGSPDNNQGLEDKMMMWQYGGWNDVRADGEWLDNPAYGLTNFGLICEWDNGTVIMDSDLIVNISADKVVTNDSKINITVDISGEVRDSAWITIVPSNIPHTEKDGDDNNGDWCRLKDIENNTVSLRVPSELGNYDIRVYNDDYSDDAKEVAYFPFKVVYSTLEASISVDSRYVKPDTDMTIYVEMSGAIRNDAWITFVPSDVSHTEKDGDDHNGKWCYLKDITDGKAVLTTPYTEGNYDIRIFDGDDADKASEVAYLPIVVTNDDVQITTRSAYSRIQGEDFDESFGVAIQGTNSSDSSNSDEGVVGWIDNGDYTVYKNVDFGNSVAKSFTARTSVLNAGLDSTIEVRLDSVDGTCIGNLSVSKTGGWNDFQVTSCNVTDTTGMHDVYLVYTGSGSDYLLNLDYFTFGKESVTDNTESALMGDVNLDGNVTLADCVTVLQYVANSGKYPLNDVAKNNADVYNRGDGITGMDALAIQKYDSGILTSLPESYQ